MLRLIKILLSQIANIFSNHNSYNGLASIVDGVATAVTGLPISVQGATEKPVGIACMVGAKPYYPSCFAPLPWGIPHIVAATPANASTILRSLKEEYMGNHIVPAHHLAIP